MAKNLTRAVLQRLESLERAGVTHVKKVSKRPAPPRAEEKPITTTSPITPMKPKTDSGEKVLAPAPEKSSADPRCAALAAVARDVAACTRCAELARTRTQTVFGVGNPYARLVFCGEAPGADEDRQGEPFVGRAGQLLTDIIVKGMKMCREDVYILNILRCRPPGNRTPLPGRSRQLP